MMKEFSSKVIVFDMDDTLYFELDFVKSGFQAVSNYVFEKHNLCSSQIFCELMNDFVANGSGKNLNVLCDQYKEIDLKEIIDIYRFHTPNIKLPIDSEFVLTELRRKGHKLALLTDGHEKTQLHKIQSLGLEKYIDFIIRTGVFGTPKPDTNCFEMIQEKFPNCDYTYIADNPKKDFIAPEKLGWQSIRIINANGIYHKYPTPESVREITSLCEIVGLF
ncbi:HAD family hydrolase [Bacteriovorax sp. BSW11_IV]|uniref:HAD family hydrolase n=1 Tax=Bacteriovorax sp. BSW11_IV TaxID=1353529 RepID=UPI0009DC0328|nr:HAD family hydrolase [Bacteriovorax sp. BSW11_IV]